MAELGCKPDAVLRPVEGLLFACAKPTGETCRSILPKGGILGQTGNGPLWALYGM